MSRIAGLFRNDWSGLLVVFVLGVVALTMLRPRMAIAVHWGTLWPIGLGRVRRHRFEEPGARFIEAARLVAPDVSIPLLDPGDSIELPPASSKRSAARC